MTHPGFVVLGAAIIGGLLPEWMNSIGGAEAKVPALHNFCSMCGFAFLAVGLLHW